MEPRIIKPDKKVNPLDWFYGKFYMILFVIIIITAATFMKCHAMEYLISDKAFTNQDYTFLQIKRFAKAFPDNKMKDTQLWFLYMQCRYFSINALVAITKIEMESNLIKNNTKASYNWKEHRAMAYGLPIKRWIEGKKYYKYGFYEVQVFSGVQCLRKHFDKWNPGKKARIINQAIDIFPENAASYSLYRYTPFYGKHAQYGWEAGGNEIFVKIYEGFKKTWDECKTN